MGKKLRLKYQKAKRYWMSFWRPKKIRLIPVLQGPVLPVWPS
ncbi:UNVERIFIED_CONTAM: hypothetical protein GTU68_021139 [Idotea baltica]|nr:hypothetical protein [Idotea baltica]